MTASERVPNKPLSGDEVKQIILADFHRMLDNEGLLTNYSAHGRIGYDVTLRLHLDNPFNPESRSSIASKAPLETAPLSDPSPEAVAAGDRVSRQIDSPNAERLRMGMPIPVDRKEHDGTVVTDMVKYPPNTEIGDNAKLEDVTRETCAGWGLPVAQEDKPTEPPVVERMGKCGHTDKYVALGGNCTQCGEEWVDATTPDPVPVGDQAWPANKPDKRDAFYGG